jgi:ZIP family zinc transporter
VHIAASLASTEYLPVYTALLLSFLAGAAIPAGGALAAIEHISPQWLEQEFRHTVIAFGGGALMAAVALVLVPEGMKGLPAPISSLSFLAGGIGFFLLDQLIALRSGQAAQFMAMLLDYIPEAIALGATFASGGALGPLLAFLIGLQNLPEGFNAFREITAPARITARRALTVFSFLPILGPISALVGIMVFARHTALLSALMLFCAGGILYLTFQDIAPQAKLEKHWAPPLGAVCGFLLGMIAQSLTAAS